MGASRSPVRRLGSGGIRARRQGRQAVFMQSRSMLAQIMRPRRVQHRSCLTHALHANPHPKPSALTANGGLNNTLRDDIYRISVTASLRVMVAGR